MSMETYRIEVGRQHGVEPRNIVGALANEAGMDSKDIGRIAINDDFSLVDLPKGMPEEIFAHLKTVWVANRQLAISRVKNSFGAPAPGPRGKPAAAKDKPRHKKSAKKKSQAKSKGKPKRNAP